MSIPAHSATGTVAMQKAYCRIEPYPFQAGGYIVAQQRVDERQQGIGGITWWSAITPLEAEGFIVTKNQMIEDIEVGAGGGAFVAANGV